MATQASTVSNRENEMAAASAWSSPPEGGTKPQYPYTNPGEGSDGTPSDDQSASGADNPSSGTTTPDDGSTGGDTTSSADGDTGNGSGGPLPGIGGLSGITDVVDLGNGSDDGSGLELAGDGAVLQPVFDTVNGAVDDVTGSSGLVQGVVDVAHTAGVGTIGITPAADGHSNLLTDVLNLPGNILGGDLNGGLSHITSDLTDTVNATTGLVGDVLGVTGLPTDSLLGGDSGKLIGDVVNLPNTALDGGIQQTVGDLTGTVSGLTGTADGLGGNGLLQPVTHLVDSAGSDLQSNSVLGIGGDGATGGILSGSAGDIGGSSSGDAAHASIGPESDDGLGVGVLSSSDSSHTADINALDVGSDGPQIADLSVLSGADGLNAPALSGLGLGDLTGGESSGLLTINGGNNADNGGVVGGVVGDLNGSSSGHLVNADAGPQENGLGVGVLTSQAGADHTVSASAVDTGPQGPQLADLGVLTGGDALHIPSLGGAGVDSLAGNLLAAPSPAAATDAAPAPVTASLGDAVDLLPGAITGDHGIVDVGGHHII